MSKIFGDTCMLDRKKMSQVNQALGEIFRSLDTTLYSIGNNSDTCCQTKDLDFLVDVHELAAKLECTPDQVKHMLAAKFRASGCLVKIRANIVHVSLAITERNQVLFRAQVDVILCENPAEIQHFHKYKPGLLTGSLSDRKYKNRHRHIILARRAKEKGYLWSPFQGLFKRKNGKKADFVTCNQDAVGEILFNDKMVFLLPVDNFVERYACEQDYNSPRWNK